MAAWPAFLSWCCRCWTYRRPPWAQSLSHRGYPWQSDSGKCQSRWCGGWRSPWYRSEDWQRILAAWRGPWKPYSPWLHHLWHRKKKMFCFIQRLHWEAAGFTKGGQEKPANSERVEQSLKATVIGLIHDSEDRWLFIPMIFEGRAWTETAGCPVFVGQSVFITTLYL